MWWSKTGSGPTEDGWEYKGPSDEEIEKMGKDIRRRTPNKGETKGLRMVGARCYGGVA